MTELELDQLPPTEADEDSQQLTATLGDVRRIVAEELRTAGLITRTELERALEGERYSTAQTLDSRLNAEREQTTARINKSEHEFRDAIREITSMMRRIEDNITGTISTITTALRTQVDTSLDNNRRIGLLENKDDEIINKIQRNHEEISNYRLEHDESLRRMGEFSDVLLGNTKTGRVGVPARLDAVTGSVALIEERTEKLERSLERIEAVLKAIDEWRAVWTERGKQLERLLWSRAGKITGGIGLGVILYELGKTILGG